MFTKASGPERNSTMPCCRHSPSAPKQLGSTQALAALFLFTHRSFSLSLFFLFAFSSLHFTSFLILFSPFLSHRFGASFFLCIALMKCMCAVCPYGSADFSCCLWSDLLTGQLARAGI
jgi:hypothetical protein